MRQLVELLPVRKQRLMKTDAPFSFLPCSVCNSMSQSKAAHTYSRAFNLCWRPVAAQSHADEFEYKMSSVGSLDWTPSPGRWLAFGGLWKLQGEEPFWKKWVSGGGPWGHFLLGFCFLIGWPRNLTRLPSASTVPPSPFAAMSSLSSMELSTKWVSQIDHYQILVCNDKKNKLNKSL